MNLRYPGLNVHVDLDVSKTCAIVRQTDVLTMSEGRRKRGTERRRDVFVETATLARGDY